MLTRIHISAFVGFTILLWLVALWVQGQPVLSWAFLKPFSIVVGLVVVVTAGFNRWAWAWPCFRGWFVDRPDLRGTWIAVLKSDWIDPKTGHRIDPIIGYVLVRQTMVALSVRLMTKESKSQSISYGITKESDEIYRLAVVYRNEPQIELQGSKSEMHHGSFWLEVLGDGPDRLTGHYWTDRGTRGGMYLSHRNRNCFQCFADANQAFSDELKRAAVESAS